MSTCTFALISACLKVWPTSRVSDLPDQGNTSYCWALLNYVLGAEESEDELLGEIRRLTAEKARIDAQITAKIRIAAATDYSLRQIGEAAGISHQTVARLVGEEAA